MITSAEFHLHLPGILLAYSLLAIGVLSPGPAILAIISTSMERGRGPGLQLALGVVSGSAFWGVSAAIGMSALLVAYASALNVIKIIGGCYLLWLSWKSFRTLVGPSNAAQLSAGLTQRSPSQMWLAGFLIHLTNPKAILVWIAAIALGVSASSPLWVSFAIVIGGLTISISGNIIYALVFSSKPMAAMYLRAKKPIAAVFAGFFAFAGFKLITSKIG
ncbi:MAG: lysine transporter LysE [Hyphomicrobiales bacterium]|nr:MAG: lysine transporter LysE [Hyphomicrobiales bacterium]